MTDNVKIILSTKKFSPKQCVNQMKCQFSDIPAQFYQVNHFEISDVEDQYRKA